MNIFDALKLVGFLKNNLKDPDKIVEAYYADTKTWEDLKTSFPQYKKYLADYPDLVNTLRERGIPL